MPGSTKRRLRQLNNQRSMDALTACVAVVAASLVSSPASGATWANNTANADANWSTATNWVASSIPGTTSLGTSNADVASFPSAVSVENPYLDASRRMGQLLIDNAGADYNVTGAAGVQLHLQNPTDTLASQLAVVGGGTTAIGPHVRIVNAGVWNTGSANVTLSNGFSTNASGDTGLTPWNTVPIIVQGNVSNQNAATSGFLMRSSSTAVGSMHITGNVINGAAVTRLGSDGGSTNSFKGTLTLSGNNNFSGDIVWRTGTIEFASATAAGTGTVMSFGTATAGSSAVSILITGPYTLARNLTINGDNNTGLPTIGGSNTSGVAIYSGTFANSGSTGGVNVTAATGGVVDFSNTISGSASTSGIITKIGGGTLRLTKNTGNTYAGNTNVNEGAVLANNTSNSATGTGNVIVNGTGTFGGTGAVSGSVTINAGGMLSPGDLTLAAGSRAGTLATGALSFSGANAAFSVNINGTTAGDGTGFYDQVLVTGTVTLSNDVNFTVDLGAFDPLDDGTQLFTLIANDSTDAKLGAGLLSLNGSNPLAQGEEFVVGAQKFLISYTSGGTPATFVGGGNDIALLAVPEPASLAMLTLGALSLLRRRHRAA